MGSLSVPAGEQAFEVGHGGQLRLDHPDVQAVIEAVQTRFQTMGNVGDVHWFVDSVEFKRAEPPITDVRVRIIRYGHVRYEWMEEVYVGLIRYGASWLAPRQLSSTLRQPFDL